MNTEKIFQFLHRIGLIHLLIPYSKGLRKEVLKSCHYNTDLITNRLSYIDMVTDSYMHRFAKRIRFLTKGAVEVSFIELNNTIKNYFGYDYVFPIAQGRMAEMILTKVLNQKGSIVPNNQLFITTRMHQEKNTLIPVEVSIEEAYKLNSNFRFKGNISLQKLEQLLSGHAQTDISHIYVECCVNASGGHPVSMQNIKEVYQFAKVRNILLILDATRILENAYFIKEYEHEYSKKSIKLIVKEFCSYSDGCTMSATKDFFIETGGFVAINNEIISNKLQNEILLNGDGLSIRGKANLRKALMKGLEHTQKLSKRIKGVEQLWTRLSALNLPVVYPPGGHAVFLDASELNKTMNSDQSPIKTFLASLYLESGIAASENFCTPKQNELGIQLIRFAISKAGITQYQIRYISRKINKIWRNFSTQSGLRKIPEKHSENKSFFERFEPIDQI